MKFKSSFHNKPRLLKFIAIGALLLIAVRLPQNFALSIKGAKQAEENTIDRYLKRYDHVAMDLAATARKVQATGELSISSGYGTFDMILTPSDIRAARYRAEEVADGGITSPVTAGVLPTYRGTIPGLPGSEVRFSVREDALEGIILTPGEWYFVEPMRNYDRSAVPSDIVVYRASDLQPEAIGTCGASLVDRIEGAERVLHSSGESHGLDFTQVTESTASIPVADVATEADYEYVTAMGGSSGANTSILEILNQVDGIYQSQLAISLQVSYQHSWATAGDPYTSTAPSSMLVEFKNYWEANLGTMTYDVAHMWTGKDMDGSVIGIAYLDVVCGVRSYSYGVSQIFNSAPGKYILTAHEIGHNFGATHTDQATPVPANCSNTIMNSMVGTGTNFCPFSKTEIAAHLSQYSSCMATTSTGNCDANNDSQINVLDAQALVNTLLGIVPCSGDCDDNNDGSVNVLDLQLLVNIILGRAGCP
jgi:hypothetical protein